MRATERVDSQIFGYASLAFEPGAVAELPGWRRVWNVAMDNSVDLPGYKYYVDATTGERPELFVAFLNLEQDPDAVVSGRLFDVPPAQLEELDRRERNYVRESIEVSVADNVRLASTYVGSPGGRRRFEVALGKGKLVVDDNYHQRVREHFRAMGDEQLERFDATTDPPPGKLLNLRRVDLP